MNVGNCKFRLNFLSVIFFRIIGAQVMKGRKYESEKAEGESEGDAGSEAMDVSSKNIDVLSTENLSSRALLSDLIKSSDTASGINDMNDESVSDATSESADSSRGIGSSR